MKTFREIEKDLIERFVSYQDKITNFVLGSAVRAIFISIASELALMYNDIAQITRRLFLDTARSDSLDKICAETGVTRRGAIATSVMLVFTGEVETGISTDTGVDFLEDISQEWDVDEFIDGTWLLKDSEGNNYTITGNTATRIDVTGTPAAGRYYVMPVVPTGTQFNSAVSSVGYELQEDVIVGDLNPGLTGTSQSAFLGNRGVAESLITGSGAAAPALTITVIPTPIPGIVSVTNPHPSQPRSGLNAETDEQLRERRRNIVSLMNQGTQAFYESLAVESDIRVSRTIALKDTDTDGVKILIATRSGAVLQEAELSDISDYITERARAFDTINCYNMEMTDIFVSLDAIIRPGVSLQSLYTRTADAIADYLDYGKWALDRKLVDDDLLVELKKIRDYRDIDLATFSVSAFKGGTPAGSKNITFVNSLPRLARLRINQIDSIVN